MNAIISGLNAYIGLVSIIVAFIVAYVASRSLVRSKVGDATNQSQNNAIAAMQQEIESIRRKLNDITSDNNRLKQTIHTIKVALKSRGLIITISDDIIDITDNGKSTTIRMEEK